MPVAIKIAIPLLCPPPEPSAAIHSFPVVYTVADIHKRSHHAIA